MITNNVAMVSAASMGADVTSSAFQIINAPYASVQAVWSGTPTGTLKLQVSNDLGIDGTSTVAPTVWTDVANSQSLAGSAGNYNWELSLTNPASRWVRIIYTKGSSTGSLTARLNTKGF